MFQFTGSDSLSGDGISSAGLPHSGIRESKPACGSSRLFAAFRALLRLIRLGIRPTLFAALLSPLNPNVFFLLCNFQGTLSMYNFLYIELLVGLGRLELPTSRLSGVRSNRLSYRPFGDEEI